MFRWRGRSDEPEVELPGELTDSAEIGVVGERARSWWPLWSAALVLAVVGVASVATRSATEPQPFAEPPATDGRDATPTTGPVLEELDDAIGATTTVAGPPPTTLPTTTSADISSEPVDVAALGLTGRLLAASDSRLYALDLQTGVWSELDPGAPYAGGVWGRQILPAPTGFVVSGHGRILSYDHSGDVLDEFELSDAGSGRLAADETSVWGLIPVEEPGLSIELVALDDSGRFEVRSVIESAGFGGISLGLVVAGGVPYSSHTGGGIYDLSSSPATRRADGFVVAGNADRMIRVMCGATLDSCGGEWLDVATFESLGPVTGDFGPRFVTFDRGFSPDLEWWIPTSGDGEVFSTRSGGTGHTLQFVEARPAWSLDSRWVARWIRGSVHLLDPSSGAVVVLPAPGELNRPNGVALGFLPPPPAE